MDKRSGRRAALRGKRVALAVAAAFLPLGEAYALPTGEQVVAGQVAVSRPDPQKMQIDQTSQKGIVNWQGFSIGASEHVNITQPNSSAALLNRVVGNSPSEIFGRLTANGQVFLVNNAGVLFAPGSSVEVGSLLASSLSISDANFLNGNYQFYNPGNAGSVVNQGNIVTANGYTALLGPQVRNDGVIVAQHGSVALAAGDRVSLDLIGDGLISVSVDQAALNASVINTGEINADGGTVLLTARSANALLDTVINSGGVIRANSLVERNGEIILDGGSAGVVAASGTLQAAGGTIRVVGDKVGLFDAARIDVSAESGGGAVLVGDDRTTAVFVGENAAINASATVSGHGGRVIVRSQDSTRIYGAISARGAGEGSGGFVETSSGYLEITRAPEVGVGGTWLIDPYNIEVVAGAGTSNNGGATAFEPTGDDSQIGADLIRDQLNAGTNVILDTGVAGSQEGNITFSAGVFKSAMNTSSLQLNAADDVLINAPVQLASGDLNVVAGGDMVVRSLANAMGGSMTITLGGDLSVLGTAGAAQLGAQSGQTITARSVEVTAQGGGSATLTNGSFGPIGTPSSGNQVITVTGGAPGTGLTVQTLAGGGFARISADGGSNQTVNVVNGDHINVNGAGGGAGIYNFGGTQTLSLTGNRANALTLGSAGALGPSQIIGGLQNVTAGVSGESGSISIVGADGNSTFTGFSSGQIFGGTQTVSTSGSLRISGGSAPNQPPFGFATGLFHNGSGEQRMTAANLEMQGGPTGVNNVAIIISSGGANTITPGGQVINVGGNVGLAGGSGGSNNTAIIVSFADQTVTAGSVGLRGGAGGAGNGAFINIAPGVGPTAGNQLFNVAGDLTVTGGTGGGAGVFNTWNGQQTISANGIVLQGGTGVNSGAFIGSSQGGDQTIIVPGGTIAITGGVAGTGNRAGIVTNANQTISGNPNIVLTGGAGGGAGNASNNVFIQATGDDTKLQNINAGTVELRSGAGTDASATFNAARQVITTTGNVSLFGGAGPGGSNGVRIGGIGGTTLGPTNLNLSVGGNLLLSGGTVNSASLGSSGASTQANNITVNASGDVVLQSLGAGARIGANASANPVNPGNITVTAGGSLNVGAGTGIRANGPITLTADTLTNAGRITNGGGANIANMIFNADAFNLAAGHIDAGAAAVIVRPRTGTNSFGIESAGATTLSNADIASIDTSNFVVFGSGIGTTFTGNMTIGENAQVNGGTKSLAFFRSSSLAAPGTITIGAQGVTSTSDVIVGAGGGAIVSNGGTVAGDEVQLRATQGIAAPGARVQTAANALAINTSGAAFVNEANDVTLRTVSLNVGGMQNTFSNSTGGTFDLVTGGTLNVAGSVFSGAMNINAAGALNVTGAGTQDGILSSSGGQTITAQSVNVTAQNGRLGQIVNNGSGEQTITTGALSVSGGSVLNYPVLSGIVQNAGDAQTINASSVQVQGTDVGANNGIFIRAASGDQRLNVTGDISIAAGAGGEAWIQGSPTGQQTIYARNITMTNALGGTNSFAALQAGHQEIHASGDVRLTAGATGSTQGGVRMGGLRNPLVQTATDLRLDVEGDLVLTGGSAPDNGASIGTSGSFALPNNIYIDAGSVVLNAGTASGAGTRIGSGSNALAGGSIEIHADRGIELNGTNQSAAIRTLGNVTLDAASISQGSNGFIRADTLTTTTTGAANLAGPNDIARFHGTSGGNLTLVDAGALQVLGITTSNDAITLTTDSLTNTGVITNGGAASNANMIFNADAFNLAGGAINAGAAAVIVRPRTGTNSFGIESAGATTLTNADIASIDTSNFVVFGSGMGTTFTGNMTIGANAQVNGGTKSLAFFRSSNPGGTTTIGANGVTTSGDVIISAGGGAIVSNGGTVAGDEVQLRASQGIGTAAARVQTAANRLAINNTGSQGAFVTEANDVTLGNVNLVVGGIVNNVANNVGAAGQYNVTANGAMTVDGSITTANGAITLTANSLTNNALITNGGGANTSLTLLAANAFDLDGGVVNNGAGVIAVRPRNPGNSFGIEDASQATNLRNADLASLNTTDFVVIGSGMANNFTGNMSIGADRQVEAGAKNLGFFRSLNVGGTTTIGAHGVTTTGDLIVSAGGGSIVSNGGTVAADQIQLRAATGIGSAGARVQTSANTLAINNTGGPGAFVAEANDVVLDRIVFTPGGNINDFSNFAGSFGAYDLAANGAVTLAGSVSAPNGTVTLNANQITEGVNGSVIANTLNTVSFGNTSLTGPNQVANFSGTSTAGDVVLSNTGALQISNLYAGGNASVNNVGNVTVMGPWTAVGTSTLTVASDIVLDAVLTSADVALTANTGSIIETGPGAVVAHTLNTTSSGSTTLNGPNQVSVFNGSSATGDISLNNTGDLTFFGSTPMGSINLVNLGLLNFSATGGNINVSNTGALTVTSLFGSNATVTNAGAVTVSGPWSSPAATSITTIGAGSDLTINTFMNPGGPMNLSIDGAVRVAASGTQDASLTSFGGQNISARSVEVTSRDGRFASIGNNNNGNQTITVSGGGIDIDSVSGGGFAFITNSGAGGQIITVSDGSGIHVRTSSGSGSGQINNFGAGNQTITVSGGAGVDVRTLSGTGFALISNAGTGNQTIAVSGGTGIDVASAAGFANLVNSAPSSQTLVVTGGEGIDVLSSGGGASIQSNALGQAQSIAASDADHINVNGRGGNATISANRGTQTVSITGSGSNAITLGSAGGLGFSTIAGGSNQNVTAGLAAEQGSITIVGPAANSTAASIVSGVAPGGTQTIATSGALRIIGGTAPNQTFASGVFHNGTGQQTVHASSIDLHAGQTGIGNSVLIRTNSADQRVNVAGDINIAAGAGGDALLTGSANGQQTIYARSITVTNAEGGTNSFGAIRAGHQEIHAAGDVRLTGGATAGTNGGVRIGGLSGAPTDLRLFVDGNLVQTGGSAPDNSANIGSSGTAAVDNTIYIETGGGVILNSGSASGARIGSGASLGGGTIEIHADGDIRLNGVDQNAAIRSLGMVTLDAANISEAAKGLIVAGTLNTTTSGNTNLTGENNQITNFSGSSAGDLTLNNTVALNVGNLNAANATVNNSGNVTLSGAWNSAAATITSSGAAASITEAGGSIQAASLTTASDGATSLSGPNQVVIFNGTSGSDLTLNNTAALHVTGVNAPAGTATLTTGGAIGISGPVVASGVVLNANGSIEEALAGAILANSLTTTSTGDTTLNGANQVASFNASSGGDVSLNNTGVLNVTGLIAAGDANITNIGDVTVSGPWTAGGTSSITVGSDILLNAAMVSTDVVLTANDGAIIQTPTGSITADTLNTTSSGETLLIGSNHVGSFSATTSGELAFNNASPTLTISNIETNGGAFSLTHIGDLNVTDTMAFATVNIGVSGSLGVLAGARPAEISAQGPINISVGDDLRVMGGSGDGAFARIHGYSDINLTVGGFLTINRGSGADAWARIQLASRDSVIRLHFPNLASGGYAVNGVEGLLRDGKTGFLADNGVAAPDHQLIITYGAQ